METNLNVMGYSMCSKGEEGAMRSGNAKGGLDPSICIGPLWLQRSLADAVRDAFA